MIMDSLVGGGFICAGRMSGTDMCPTNMVVCPMIFNALDLAAEADDAWTEELLIEGNPNCRAFNALWVVEPASESSRGVLRRPKRPRFIAR